MTQTAHPVELTDRFRSLFAKIAEGATERETQRRLPHEQVGWPREAS